MSGIRSRSTGETNIRGLLKSVIITLCVISVVIGVYFIYLAGLGKANLRFNMQMAQVNLLMPSYTVKYNGESVTKYSDNIGRTLYYVNKNDEQTICYIDGNSCYVNITEMIHDDMKESFLGKAWLELSVDELVKISTDVWNGTDVYRYINIQALEEIGYLELGMTGMRNMLGIGTDLVVSDSGFIIKGTRFIKDASNIKREQVRIVENWEKKLGNVLEIQSSKNGVTVVGSNERIDFSTVTNNYQPDWQRIVTSINKSSISIYEIDSRLLEMIYKNYESGKGIIESVKGAFEK